MNFIITVYRRQRTGWTPAAFSPMPVQHFNADNLAEARQKMLKAQSIKFAFKVELSVILDTWFVTGQEIN